MEVKYKSTNYKWKNELNIASIVITTFRPFTEYNIKTLKNGFLFVKNVCLFSKKITLIINMAALGKNKLPSFFIKKITMSIHQLGTGLLLIGLISCQTELKNKKSLATYNDLTIVGAMKNVMWKGALAGTINLDTIPNKKGLYGLGPQSYLSGELLINNGKSYLSKVTSDSTMQVERTFDVMAPFFVYANVNKWKEIALPNTVKTINDLEKFVQLKTFEIKKPFALKLIGSVSNATIHIQNLPEGTKVSSPDEAHQGQTNYTIQNEAAEIIGFYSTEHQGIFTHHDSFLHLHLITKDALKMGHLDALEIGTMKLYLPMD